LRGFFTRAYEHFSLPELLPLMRIHQILLIRFIDLILSLAVCKFSVMINVSFDNTFSDYLMSNVAVH